MQKEHYRIRERRLENKIISLEAEIEKTIIERARFKVGQKAWVIPSVTTKINSSGKDDWKVSQVTIYQISLSSEGRYSDFSWDIIYTVNNSKQYPEFELAPTKQSAIYALLANSIDQTQELALEDEQTFQGNQETIKWLKKNSKHKPLYPYP